MNMKLLLHCCCAPCSISCIDVLRRENIEPELFWYNPNIHPVSEYELRRDCLKSLTEKEKLELISAKEEYNIDNFLAAVCNKTENRCESCYKLRLEKTAAFAAQEGFQAFTTTLLISPYQDHDLIKRIGEECAAKYGVEFLYRDFRPFFRDGQNAARTAGMYMQKYCGCIFSEEERFKKNFTQRRSGAEDAGKILKDKPKQISASLHSKGMLHLRENYSFDRSIILIGEDNFKKLQNTSVLVFGAGGVGSWAAETLVRSGIGKIGIIDNDTVCISNINRQIEATTLTIGKPKASTLKERLLEINPNCNITAWDELFCKESAGKFKIEEADYVIDAIDSLNHKLDLIEITCNTGIKLFSSMGMAFKLDPSLIKSGSIWKTEVCPLARHVRQGLRKRNFNKDFTVVYSGEKPYRTQAQFDNPEQRPVNGSIVTVTASAGLLLTSLIIRDILSID